MGLEQLAQGPTFLLRQARGTGHVAGCRGHHTFEVLAPER